MITPVRIHRSWAKGARMVSPNGLPTVCVTRPGPYGNPYLVGDTFTVGYRDHRPVIEIISDAGHAVKLFENTIHLNPYFIRAIKHDLKNKDIACWCHIWKCQKCKECFDCDGGFDNPPWCGLCKSFMTRVPCHGDVLLRIANE